MSLIFHIKSLFSWMLVISAISVLIVIGYMAGVRANRFGCDPKLIQLNPDNSVNIVCQIEEIPGAANVKGTIK